MPPWWGPTISEVQLSADKKLTPIKGLHASSIALYSGSIFRNIEINNDGPLN